METYLCWINGEKYFFDYADPQYNATTKSYSGVARFWKEDCEEQKDTVSFYTKEDEVDLTHQKIQEQIEKKVNLDK